MKYIILLGLFGILICLILQIRNKPTKYKVYYEYNVYKQKGLFADTIPCDTIYVPITHK